MAFADCKLGMGDRVPQSAALDPRMSGSTAPPAVASPPIANAGADTTVAFNSSVDLEGRGSTAGPGRSLERYIWRLLPPVA